MAVRRITTNPYAGWAQYARGYMTQGNNVPQGGNANYPAGTPPFQGWADYARGYQAAHPDPYAGINFGELAKLIAAQQGPPPPPFDPVYDATVANANRLYGDTSANINYDESQLSPTYGYQADASGNVTVDPSNPFSRAALLQRTYNQSQAGNTNRFAAQGQLYSGALQNAQNVGTLGFQQNTDALKRAYQKALQAIRQRRQAALTQRDTTITTAGGDRTARALATRPT